MNLEHLKTQLANYVAEKDKALAVFQQFLGAIGAVQQLIAVFESKKEDKDGDVDNQGTEQPSEV
jgi:hypothetical protein